MVSAAGTTIAPGVIIAPRWMSSISLKRASATLIARRSASASASLRNASSARPSARAAGGDPGADRVGGVQPHLRAGALVGLMGGDEGAELFEGRHRSNVYACVRAAAA